MNSLMLTQLTPEQLRKEISSAIKTELKDFLFNLDRQCKADDYLSRKEVAAILNINLSTVHNWCKNGKLIPYGIGSRVYFRRSDVFEQCLKPLNPSLCGQTS